MKAQKNTAFVKLQTTKSKKNLHFTSVIAGFVICPIKVLKAKDVITPIDTPLDRVFVSKISGGIIHESGPHVKEKVI